eukprot:4677459-Pleurochrysis_carterae.AAC.1
MLSFLVELRALGSSSNKRKDSEDAHSRAKDLAQAGPSVYNQNPYMTLIQLRGASHARACVRMSASRHRRTDVGRQSPTRLATRYSHAACPRRNHARRGQCPLPVDGQRDRLEWHVQ